jgi:WD40 repeat protein
VCSSDLLEPPATNSDAQERFTIHHAEFHPNRRHLLTSGPDGVMLWDLEKKARVLNVPGDLHACAFSSDGRRAFIAGWRECYLLDLQTKRITKTLKDPDGRFLCDYLSSAAFSPDGRHVALGTDVGAVAVWDTEENTIANRDTFEGQPVDFYDGAAVTFISRDPRASRWVYGRKNGDILTMEIPTWKVERLHAGELCETCGLCSADSCDLPGDRVLLHSPAEIRFFSLSERRHQSEWKPITTSETAVFSTSGQHLAVLPIEDTNVVVFRSSDKQEERVFDLAEIAGKAVATDKSRPLNCATFDSTDQLLFIGTSSGGPRSTTYPPLLIDVRNRKFLGSLQSYCPDRTKETRIVLTTDESPTSRKRQ